MEEKTILIGEDDEFLLQFIRVAFTMEGFRVEVARSLAGRLTERGAGNGRQVPPTL